MQPPSESSNQRVVRRYRPLPGWLRAVATFMLPVYLITSLPNYLLAQAELTVHEVSLAVAESLKPVPLEINVNRTLPPGVVDDNAPGPSSTVTSTPLRFSSPKPKDSDFFQARLFAEPLIPTSDNAAASENDALAKVLLAYAQVPAKADGDIAQRVEPVRAFLVDHPTSRWSLSLWLNLGLLYRKAGYWTKAMDAWEKAWATGKRATAPGARALGDRAVAELAELNARLGRYERLKPLFDELDASGRDLRGAASDKLAGARQGLWMMDNQPELAFRCGPMALNCLRLADNPKASLEPKILDAHSTRLGISLSQVAALSRDIGRPMQMAFRTPDKNGHGADFITPSVVHWTAGHYAALVEQKNGRYRVDDPTFGDTNWVSRAALEAETDGYYLVSAQSTLPVGWRAVASEEGDKIWGKGTTSGKDPNATRCKDLRVRNCPQCPHGMADYNVEALLTSLAIGDTPLSYSPPRGMPVDFSVQYSQHEASQPAVPTFWNLGPRWSSQWLSYIEDNGTDQWKVVDTVTATNPDGSHTTYTIYAQLGGVATGPLPVTHLGGGGVETYGTLTQTNSFLAYDPSSVYYSFDSGDQTPVYRSEEVYVFPSADGSALTAINDALIKYTTQVLVHPRLVQTGDVTYKRYLPDGTVETFGHSDRNGTYPRRIFLTKRTDPSGNSLTFSYDNTQRLLAVTDALGQVSTLAYELAADPLKVTKVTDPFGRACHFAYNSDGQLASITDTAGIQSSFTYADNDFIDSLTTPYGTSTFAFGDVTTDPTLGVAAWLEATDPYGDTERAEFRHRAPGITDPETTVPQGIPVYNAYINARNTFYWDKKTYREAHNSDGTFDYTRAKIFHFLHTTDINVCSGVLESTKNPLENRVWLSYQGQTWPAGVTDGMSTQPSMVARVLDDGTTQLSQYQYNDQQRVTKATDPLGRETTYDYDADNHLDLLATRCTTGGLNERLFSATYNTAHQPLTTTDAAGQTTTMTYTGDHQVHTVSDPLGRVVTFQYNPAGYLAEIDGFDPAIKSTFAYDPFGRLASTTTYPDAYTVQVGYDAVGGDPLLSLNRPVSATYPDGSYTEVDYTHLDPEWLRDRGGNWTHLLTNQLRQTVASIDPLGHVTEYGYCKCGQLVKLVDPNGNVTQWTLDAAERPSAKVYADHTEVDYTYEATTSRLRQVTDAKGQHTNYLYNLDGTLASVSYTDAEHPTPGVSYTYDPAHGRLATMVDGIGTTTYGYYPLGTSTTPGAPGAGRVQSVSGPFANETVSYAYDPLGRVSTRTVDGVDETYGFDPLGRMQTDTNALGTFTYGYEGATSRLSSVTYPNGVQALYSYLPGNAQDHRLSQIKHLTPTGTTLDQFDYAYDGPLGRIAHWGQQQPGATAGSLTNNAYDLSYDATGQLTRAVLNGDESDPGSGVWRYDPAGNRVGVQTGSGTLTTAVPTPTNALFSITGGGKVRVAGTLSEWAQVTVNGKMAQVDANTHTFEVFVPLDPGTQTLTINATDASGNTATNHYQLAITSGVGTSFGYDANGNTTELTSTASGATPQSMEWDACDRVIAINTGTHRTEFEYDGKGIRVRMTEKENGSTISDQLYVIGEEREAANGQILRRFFDRGQQRNTDGVANDYFYGNDHLDSLRTFTDSSGDVKGSYSYDVWGDRFNLVDGLKIERSYTGHWYHSPTKLEFSPTRMYDGVLGRWLTRDPIKENGGHNLYAYVQNDPVNSVDPEGLDRWVVDPLGLHPYMIVQGVDSNGHRTGQLQKIEFGPGSTSQIHEVPREMVDSGSVGDINRLEAALYETSFSADMGALLLLTGGLLSFGQPHVSTWTDPIPTYGLYIQSDAYADQLLLWNVQQDQTDLQPYSFWLYNSRHWMNDHMYIGLDCKKKKYWPIWIPWF